MKRLKKGVLLLLCCSLMLGMTACGKFDAKGYVQALLDHRFQGDTEELLEFDKDIEEKKLKEDYEQYIRTFSEGLTEGLNAGGEMEEKFYTVCKEIFRSMKYNVVKEEKISNDEYKVTVEIQPTDVFVNWKKMLQESMVEIQQKSERGEYKGTEEEILQLMLLDITAQSYELLETAYAEVSYGEKEEVTLTIKKGENKEFAPKEEEISDLIAKILRLDAIQD